MSLAAMQSIAIATNKPELAYLGTTQALAVLTHCPSGAEHLLQPLL